ncbi:MAG: hypothetical protein AB1427_17165 [Thermodesulfobacteriota bacterium]
MKTTLCLLTCLLLIQSNAFAGQLNLPPIDGWGTNKVRDSLIRKNVEKREMERLQQLREQETIEKNRQREDEIILFKTNIILQQAQTGDMTEEGKKFLEKHLGSEAAEGAVSINERKKQERQK